MADTVTLDHLDEPIVRCLPLRPRAAVGRIAARGGRRRWSTPARSTVMSIWPVQGSALPSLRR
jgi:hypothetical protein